MDLTTTILYQLIQQKQPNYVKFNRYNFLKNNITSRYLNVLKHRKRFSKTKIIPSWSKFCQYASTFTCQLNFMYKHLHKTTKVLAITVIGLNLQAYLTFLLKDTYLWQTALNEFFAYQKKM